MTERLDVNCDSIIDYNDVNEVSYCLTNPGTITIDYYTNNSNLIENSTSMYYTKVNISGNTVNRSDYWVASASVISETHSSLLSVNMLSTENISDTSSSNGVVKITATIGNETIIGTGVVADDNTILTTASNLCKKVNNTWRYASNVRCDIYTMSGTRIYSGYNANSYYIPSNYTALSDNLAYNYAAVKLDENVDLYDYKMELGVPTTNYNGNIKTTSVSVSAGAYNGTSTRLHSLYGQGVNGGFINYTGGYGEVEGQNGAPVYVEDSNGNKVVIGIAGKYVNGMSSFNRGIRIDQDILRLISSL